MTQVVVEPSCSGSHREAIRTRPFILGHYRTGFNSWAKAFSSIFRIHNQSFNVWSHLSFALVLLVTVALACKYLSYDSAQAHLIALAAPAARFGLIDQSFIQKREGAIYPPEVRGRLQQVSVMPVVFQLICAAGCLLCSAVFHLFSAVSPAMEKILLRLDYGGINFLILGTNVPVTYFIFYDDATMQGLLISLQVVINSSIFLAGLFPFFHTQKYLWLKASAFASAGIMAGLPIYLYLIYPPLSHFSPELAASYFSAMGFCYLGGLGIYASKCPQRLAPGKFDLCCSSHNLWHVAVCMGIVLSIIGTLLLYFERLMALALESQ